MILSGGFLLDGFNLIEGVWGRKGDVGFVGVKCADNLHYKNRNGTGLLSFLLKK